MMQYVFKINQAGNRKVQYDVFEVKEKGDLALLTSPDNDDEVRVYLVPVGVTDRSEMVQLHSIDVKVYNEKDIITPLQRKHLHAKFLEAVAQGISSGISAAL